MTTHSASIQGGRHWCTLLSLALVAAYALIQIHDPDFWWHLSTGRYIFNSRTIPTADIFTYSCLGTPWVSHQWGAELFFYLLAKGFGIASLVLWKALTITLIFYLVQKNAGFRLPFLTLLLLAVVLPELRGFFVERPYLFSYLLLALLHLLLEKYRQTGNRGNLLYIVPLLAALWSNLHAGFIYGIILSGIYWLASLTTAPHWKNDYLFLLLLFIAATLCNPHGFRPLLHPFMLIGLYSEHGLIGSGMLSPFSSHTAFIFPLFFSLLTVTALLLGWQWWSGQSGSVVDLLLFSCFTLLAALHRRDIFPALVVILPIALSACHRFRIALPEGKPITSLCSSRLTGYGTVLLALLIAGRTLAGSSTGPLRLGLGINSSAYPIGAVQFIKDHDLRGRMFNEVDWGGFLIWHLYPQRKILMDSRGDVCRTVLLDMQGGATGHAGQRVSWQQIVAKYGIDYTIMGYTEEVYSADQHGGRTLPQKDWALVYFDDVAMVYVKRIAKWQPLIQAYEYRVAKPDLEPGYIQRLRANQRPLLYRELSRAILGASANNIAHFQKGLLLALNGDRQGAAMEFRTVTTANGKYRSWAGALLQQFENTKQPVQ